MKGSAFKLGTVQGTSGYTSALKQKEDSALQCRMYNKDNNFTMKSPLPQSCPPGTEEVMVDEEGNPLQMKSALKQTYTDEELARRERPGWTYGDETSVTDDETGITTYTTAGTKPGSTGGRSGNPEFSAAYAEARRKGLDTFDFDGKSYNTKKSTGPESDEMSYTTGPTTSGGKLTSYSPSIEEQHELDGPIEVPSLDTITPSLTPDTDIEPAKIETIETPEEEKVRLEKEEKEQDAWWDKTLAKEKAENKKNNKKINLRWPDALRFKRRIKGVKANPISKCVANTFRPKKKRR